jgi:ATP diphosphatase
MSDINKLLEIMAALRDPHTGCPWDIEQDFRSIAPYTIEEAYEVADAIDRNDLANLRDELGDLLLQVVFHAQMASEIGAFDFDAVVSAIAEKMIRRHPHVFANETVADADAQRIAWESHKKREREGNDEHDAGALSGVTLALPALARAEKLGKRAAAVGFDWPDIHGVLAKINEEIAEIEAARNSGTDQDVAEEIGDLLFTVVNLARHLSVDAEDSLRAANQKFARRFRAAERRVNTQGRSWGALTLEELEAEWQAVKAAERAPSS